MKENIKIDAKCYLVPVVADGIGKDSAVAVEACCRDGAADLGEGLELLARVLVPEGKRSISSRSRECSVDGVPVDTIDRVHRSLVTDGLSTLAMALERKVEGSILVLDILNSDASFDTADSISCASRETRDGPGLPLQWAGHGLERS